MGEWVVNGWVLAVGHRRQEIKIHFKGQAGRKVFTNIQGASLKVCKDHGDNQPS